MATTTLQRFKNNLEARRIDIVKFIYNIFITITTVALCVYIYILFINTEYERSENAGIFSIVTIVLFVVFIFIRLRLIYINYRAAMLFATFVSLLLSLSLLITSGTENSIAILLVVVILLSLSIVVSLRVALVTLLLTIISFGLTYALGMQEIIAPTVDEQPSELVPTIIILVFIAMIFNIARIGFGEIEHSYGQAYEYALELEELNKELDKKVVDRTEMLKNNFDVQVDAMYKSSVIGNITKPLLHDLQAPLSAIEGALDIACQDIDPDNEMLVLMKRSLSQAQNTIEESRELIRGKDITQEFSAADHVQKTVGVLKSQMYRYDIDLSVKIRSDFKIKGIVSYFERIIINLLYNAIEELAMLDRERKIQITVDRFKDKGIITIEDNGSGLSENIIGKVFDEDFSLKSTSGNLGLGLPFVKKTIEEKFDGTIRVESKKDSYTRFILKFKSIDGDGSKEED